MNFYDYKNLLDKAINRKFGSVLICESENGANTLCLVLDNVKFRLIQRSNTHNYQHLTIEAVGKEVKILQQIALNCVDDGFHEIKSERELIEKDLNL